MNIKSKKPIVDYQHNKALETRLDHNASLDLTQEAPKAIDYESKPGIDYAAVPEDDFEPICT